MQYLDIMASLHLNIFHWHLTDEPGWRIEIKRYPDLTKIGAVGNWHDADASAAFYTQEDIKDIVSYAAERHIMVIPEIDMPGHATSACRAYPEISGGGDEVHYGNQNWFTDSDIQQFIKENHLVNETGLEHYFIRRVADIVASKGKKMIGWDEIVDADVSPEKAVVMWWRHDRKYQLVKALERGYQVILTPRLPMYGDFVQYPTHQIGRLEYNLLEDVYRFPESLMNLVQGYEKQLLGIQYSMWTERIADNKRLDFMTFPRLFAFAEAAWSPTNVKYYGRFMKKLPSYLNVLDQLGIYYFNPFNPSATPEPIGPDKQDVLKNG